MAATNEQARNFFVDTADAPAMKKLQASVNWIGDNMHPYDVFTYQQLTQWATDNGFAAPSMNNSEPSGV